MPPLAIRAVVTLLACFLLAACNDAQTEKSPPKAEQNQPILTVTTGKYRLIVPVSIAGYDLSNSDMLLTVNGQAVQAPDRGNPRADLQRAG